MLQPIDQIQAIIGADFGGGFFGGSVSVDLKPYVIVIAPKGPGERVDLPLVNHPSRSEAFETSSYWSSSLTKDGLGAIECFTSNGGYDSFGSGTEILSARAIRKVAI